MLQTVAAIYAISENGVIGKDNDIPWRLPADLKHFKRITLGYPVIMGRKTYESIGRPLPKRRNLVITRNSAYQAEGIEVFGGLEAALEACPEAEKVFLIGGADLFRVAFAQDLVKVVYETLVHADIEGDVYFELPQEDTWEVSEVVSNQADERNEYAYTYRTLTKT